jgi:Autophagy protein Apg9.
MCECFQVIKREPGSLGSRCWSLYGRLYLRHFNELDHELNARLNRAYRPASKYMNIFTSPLMSIVAQ